MNSASSLDSELINKIALDFTHATGLAVVVVNIHGDEISEHFNFTQFCKKMRENPELYARCKMSDRCGGLEASKDNKPCIYRCHAGLTDFSIPLIIAGHLVGFVLCGQVRVINDESIGPIKSVDQQWQNNLELLKAFESIPLVDYSKVMASADLLKLIVDNCIKKHVNFIVINDSTTIETEVTKPNTVYDVKIKKALRYIDSHFSEDLRLEDSRHMYI